VWWTDNPLKAHKLRKHARGKDVEDLNGLIESRFEKKDANLRRSRATDADIDIPVPDGLNYLPYQRAGIAYALENESTIIGDEMGLGKTIQSIGVINATPDAERVLVICPASLKINWKQELQKWLVRPMNIEIVKAGGLPDADVTIINYDILHKHADEIRARPWDVMIVDESHYLKNPKARRTKQVLGGKGVSPIIAKRKMFLTGTPMVNRPIELYPLLKSIDKREWGNWKNYVTRYCNAYVGSYGWDVSGASNLAELQDRLRSTCMIRRLKSQVLKDLPAKRRQVIEISGDDYGDTLQWEAEVKVGLNRRTAELKVRAELAKASESRHEYESAVRDLQQHSMTVFAEMARARHQVALAKVPCVTTCIETAVESENKVVVFAHHHDVIDKIMESAPEGTAVKLDGRDSMEKRNTAVNEFQNNDDVRIFVGGIKAAGVGLTLTASSHVIFAELDWVPGVISQAEDRCHRIGQDNQVLIQHLVVEGSIDAAMAHTLVKKQEILDLALDEEPSPEARESMRQKALQEPVSEYGGQIDHEPTEDLSEIATDGVTYRSITEEAIAMTERDITHYHRGVQIIANACDGALDKDGAGFNRVDTGIGESLARQLNLTPRQAVIAKKLCRRYRRQLQSVEFSHKPPKEAPLFGALDSTQPQAVVCMER